ncbi:MAG: MFS transporter [Rhizobiaceae bacterium]|nr:MAG: MFS transporter [Rhizobiaceae bacterium]
MRHARFRWFFFTYILAMMADKIEHVISYWMMYQKFHSPALGGFAVLSHWLPFLFFSIPMGGLADRVDPRRLIQIGMALFTCVSLGWGYLFLTDSLEMWQAMLLLVAHGCAGVFWQTPSQLLLYATVDRDDLQSAVRLNATARYLGILVGPAVGGAMLVWLGPTRGIFLNACYYLPVILWLAFFHYSRETAGRSAVKGLADVLGTLREIAARPAIVTMTVLAAAASGFIGNSYQAQMPNFAVDLGHGSPGAAYSMLLAADAAGALTAGFLLETFGGLQTAARTALFLAMGWCCALAVFASIASYPAALVCLFVAGFFELSFSSMAQTVVQIEAPAYIRGRVLGVFAMASLGCRAFAGITVGLIGSLYGVHTSLALAAILLFVVVGALFLRSRSASR